jgi:hypothetical protein
VLGPRWRKFVQVGSRHFDSKVDWRVERVENRGRVIHWRCEDDGRTARTECMPTHPDYPPDPTPEQLRKESLARIAALPVRRSY